jgi:transcriptional regulator with XRE-family HTH domain
MSLSSNIKRIRLEHNFTQEQLATKLGVSSQAVSKWETGENYPDSALILPLANELEVSLDELFDNDSVSIEDVSDRIIKLLHRTDKKDRFNVTRDICWQIERGLFGLDNYEPINQNEQCKDSYILDDYGFTIVSNGKEPFFALFPEPEDGFGHLLSNKDFIINVFTALSHEATINALIYLYCKTENYVFESEVLKRDCGISDEEIDTVLENLLLLKITHKKELTINGRVRILYDSYPKHNLIALFIMANKLGYEGGYQIQSHWRNTPFFK